MNRKFEKNYFGTLFIQKSYKTSNEHILDCFK